MTCMDSRIDPLGMLGLKPGDAKIFRNPGGRVTEAAWRPSCSGCTCSVSAACSSSAHAVRHASTRRTNCASALAPPRARTHRSPSTSSATSSTPAARRREAALAPAHPRPRGRRRVRLDVDSGLLDPVRLSGPAPGGTVAFARLLLSGPASSYGGAQPGRQPRDGGRMDDAQRWVAIAADVLGEPDSPPASCWSRPPALGAPT